MQPNRNPGDFGANKRPAEDAADAPPAKKSRRQTRLDKLREEKAGFLKTSAKIMAATSAQVVYCWSPSEYHDKLDEGLGLVAPQHLFGPLSVGVIPDFNSATWGQGARLSDAFIVQEDVDAHIIFHLLHGLFCIKNVPQLRPSIRIPQDASMDHTAGWITVANRFNAVMEMRRHVASFLKLRTVSKGWFGLLDSSIFFSIYQTVSAFLRELYTVSPKQHCWAVEPDPDMPAHVWLFAAKRKLYDGNLAGAGHSMGAELPTWEGLTIRFNRIFEAATFDPDHAAANQGIYKLVERYCALPSGVPAALERPRRWYTDILGPRVRYLGLLPEEEDAARRADGLPSRAQEEAEEEERQKRIMMLMEHHGVAAAAAAIGQDNQAAVQDAAEAMVAMNAMDLEGGEEAAGEEVEMKDGDDAPHVGEPEGLDSWLSVLDD